MKQEPIKDSRHNMRMMYAQAMHDKKNNMENENITMSNVIGSPNELEPVLAFITHQGDLGKNEWYEVVYFFKKWCSYAGSKTFDNGEQVVKWKYVKDF